MTTFAARRNPFATERLDRLGYRDPATGEPLAPADLDRLLDRLDTLGRRAAIVGPEGSGKTALLEALAARLTRRGWRVQWSARRADETAEGGLASPAGSTSFLLIDGEERLAPGGWRRLLRACRGAGGLLVTAHRPTPLPTLHECATTPELLGILISELAGGSSLGLPAAETLHARHQGNLRSALLELYDRCAGR